MYTHFRNIEKYLNTGPPVYFVVHGDIDFSRREWQVRWFQEMDKILVLSLKMIESLIRQDTRFQNKFCSLGGCSDNSIGGILSQATAHPERLDIHNFSILVEEKHLSRIMVLFYFP